MKPTQLLVLLCLVGCSEVKATPAMVCREDLDTGEVIECARLEYIPICNTRNWAEAEIYWPTFCIPEDGSTWPPNEPYEKVLSYNYTGDLGAERTASIERCSKEGGE
jgi:hypothetical protein